MARRPDTPRQADDLFADALFGPRPALGRGIDAGHDEAARAADGHDEAAEAADGYDQPAEAADGHDEAARAAEETWSEAVAELPESYQETYRLAQHAEIHLDAETVEALTFELLDVRDQAGLDEFAGKLGRKLSRAARKTVKDVGRTGIVRAVGSTAKDFSRTKLARTIGKTATDVGKGVSKVGAVVPMLGTVAKLASRATPLGALARSTYGALSAALRGQNILTGALDGLAGSAIVSALVQVGRGVLKGENLVKAAKMAAKAGISDAREALRLAAMVAPFVPGIGTGVGAALGAADALANGQPITKALVAGIRGAIPGGVIAQAAFDTGAELIQGKRLDQALLTAARNRLPPGPAQAAFDTAVALAQGKNIQDAALQAAGGLLPPSPYAADAMSFARRALAGDNLSRAALSTAGDAVLRRVKEQGGDLVATVQGRLPKPAVPKPVGFDQAFAASNQAITRQADQFGAALVGPSGPTRPRPAPRL